MGQHEWQGWGSMWGSMRGRGIDTIDYVTGIGNSIQRARPKCVTGCCAHAHSFPGSSFCCAQIRTTEAACAMAEMLTDVPAIAGR